LGLTIKTNYLFGGPKHLISFYLSPAASEKPFELMRKESLDMLLMLS